MRAPSAREFAPPDLRRAIERLDGLPMRPTTARQVLASIVDDDDDSVSALPGSAATDPAWALAASRTSGRPVDPLGVLSDHRWWPPSTALGPVAEALARLWRHSTAVAFAARRLAREAGDLEPEAVARAGMLHCLGLWALASVAPESLVAWYDAPDLDGRRALERRWLGAEASSLGRDWAARRGLEPLVVEAAWLHADLGADLGACSDHPVRLAFIQQAYALAATTPWAPGAESARESGPIDPRVRILTAEVQARCGGPFVEPDATPREERLTRDNARLRADRDRLRADQGSKDRFLRAFAASPPAESPAEWADRAALAWCGEPGVAAARVDWSGNLDPGPDPDGTRPPSASIPLGGPARPVAVVHLWGVTGEVESPARPASADAWDAWTRIVDDRARVRVRLDEVIAAHRGRLAREEPTLLRRTLAALAEFAAGAGHELNNPLAVIVGRAQLLLAKEDEPDAQRSLRAIIAQAQRAARILRDLMYVARPPEPRPRPCQPDEVVRACLRDLQGEADARGVRVVVEARDSAPRVWADPDPLRQVADILARNALEATPSGGLVQFTAGGDDRTIRWTVHDTGRGIGAAEGLHLFDPFFCGRQAGRGLGLGLPRAAKIVTQAGGELKWQSNPGIGTTFVVTLPVSETPTAPEEARPGPLGR